MSEWFKHFPRKMLDACEGLESVSLVAVYRTIIDRIYENDGPISNAPASIGKYACLRTSHTARAIAELVERGKLYITPDGRLMNPRADGELARRKDLSETRANAGSKGGLQNAKRSKSERTWSEPDANGYELGANAIPSEQKLAESGQSSEAIAASRAQEESREKQVSPQPPRTSTARTPTNGLDQMPDFSGKLDPGERLRLVEKMDVVDRVDNPDGEVVSQLTGDIMREARMTVPPSDLVLVGGWVRMGMEPAEIIQIVVRMAASARGAVRGMRYFDAEIRRVHDAKASAESSNMAYFARVLREHTP